MLFGVAGDAARARVRDRGQRVGAPGVLGPAAVVEIEDVGVGVHRDVLEHGAEHPRRGMDRGLRARREPDHLGVAAALEVEEAVAAPAVLVVAEQRPVRVGRQRGLAGAGEAEEDRRPAVLAHIDRAVHGQHVARRHEVVHDGEDRLLAFAGVSRAADQHQAAGEIEQHHGLGVGSVGVGQRLEAGNLDDGELGRVLRQLPVLRRDEQVAREQAVPGELRDHADRQPEAPVGADMAVLNEHFLALEIGRHAPVDVTEHVRRDRAVDGAPPDVRIGRGLLHDVLVVGRAAGVDAGHGDQGPAVGDLRFAAPHRLLVEGGPSIIPMGRGDVADAVLLETVATYVGSSLVHRLLARVGKVALARARGHTPVPGSVADGAGHPAATLDPPIRASQAGPAPQARGDEMAPAAAPGPTPAPAATTADGRSIVKENRGVGRQRPSGSRGAGAQLSTPISRSTAPAAAMKRVMVSARKAPMQPTRKLSTCASLPG